MSITFLASEPQSVKTKTTTLIYKTEAAFGWKVQDVVDHLRMLDPKDIPNFAFHGEAYNPKQMLPVYRMMDVKDNKPVEEYNQKKKTMVTMFWQSCHTLDPQQPILFIADRVEFLNEWVETCLNDEEAIQDSAESEVIHAKNLILKAMQKNPEEEWEKFRTWKFSNTAPIHQKHLSSSLKIPAALALDCWNTA